MSGCSGLMSGCLRNCRPDTPEYAFNESIQKANIFIIDEPELSLHIRWQEIFVETIRKLNQALQLIIATHSPSILLDDTEHCISLNKGVKSD